MNIKVEPAGPCRKRVSVEWSAEEVAAEFAATGAQYARQASLPGFRPGRVPREVVTRKFARQIAEDVRDRLVARGYQKATEQEKLNVVWIGDDVKEVTAEPGKPLAFALTVDVAPQFELPAYKGIPVAGMKTDPSDEDVERLLTHLRDRAARFTDVAGRPAREGDLVLVDYEGACDGQPVSALAPKAAGLDRATDFWMYADKEHEFIPGMTAALAGAAVGERRAVEVAFPAAFPEPALAGRTVTYQVEVKGLRERVPAAMDEEFFKTFGAADEADLRQRLRKDLQAAREPEERQRRLGEIIRHLLAQAPFDVPQSQLQEETDYEVYDLVRANTARGVSRDVIETKKEEIFDAAVRGAAERLKTRYILRRIAEAEAIVPTSAEIEDRMAMLAARQGVDPARYRAGLKRQNALDRVEEEVRLNKTLQWLLDQAHVAVA